MIPVSVVDTPSSLASDSTVRSNRLSSQCVGSFGSHWPTEPPTASRCVFVRIVVGVGYSTSQFSAVAAEVHEPAAAVVHPVARPLVLAACPVFGMGADDQDAVGVEVQRPVVELRVGVRVVREAFALQPREHAAIRPGRGWTPAGRASNPRGVRAPGPRCPAPGARTRAVGRSRPGCATRRTPRRGIGTAPGGR